MLHLYRFLRFTAVFLLFLLPLQLAGAVILLMVLPFWKKTKLPRFLKFFDSYDLHSDRDSSVYERVVRMGWWRRYNWLAWRNPLNYLEYKYLGLQWDGSEQYTRYAPYEDTVGDSTGDHPGFRHIEVEMNGHRYFEYYWIYIYPFKKDTCFRYRLGWKISDMDNPVGTVSQWCFVISPFKTFSGKLDG